MSNTQDSLGGVLITSSDWTRIREIETRARSMFDEAKVNVWALRKSLAGDVARIVDVGNGLKMAVIAGAVIGSINTLAALAGPPGRPWRGAEVGASRRSWKR